MRADLPIAGNLDRFQLARLRELQRILALARREVPGQFFTHRSAARVWGAPLPHSGQPPLHLSVFAPERAPRVRGVIGHALDRRRCEVTLVQGVPVSTPAHTWVMLGDLSLLQLVALGDFMVRVHRPGYGRRHVGRAPLTSVSGLQAVLELGRWVGNRRLRRALNLIREDSWSPQESEIRVLLALAGLPEAELNVDLFSENGSFLGCVDLLYRRYRVVVEYQGQQHSGTFAEDVERIERLRAAGWIVIQVTRALRRTPALMVARVEAALRERGWAGSSAG